VLVNKMLWNDYQHSLLQLHLEGGGWYLDLLSGMVPTKEQTFSKDCKQKVDQQQRSSSGLVHFLLTKTIFNEHMLRIVTQFESSK